MANNKVQLRNGEVLIDLTSDTVAAGDLRAGKTAHDKSGEKITGTLSVPVITQSGNTLYIS